MPIILLTVSKGFIGRKDKTTYEVKVEVFRLGFYIIEYLNGNAIKQAQRVHISKAQLYVWELRLKALKDGYDVKDYLDHKVRFDSEQLTYKTYSRL